ncbi:hypothetical protein [Massilioclostridium coli]|uniref:hypothetical protein n=1 Tax=Massilioclostridium coli TaxID=1870991 RepID=UPI00085C3103|nr:hypothetical protein [Massilioclostridium coli]
MFRGLHNLIDDKKEKNCIFARYGGIVFIFAIVVQLINMAKLFLHHTVGETINSNTLLLTYMTVLVTASIALAGLLLLAYGYHFIYLKAAPFIGAAFLCFLSGYIVSGFWGKFHTMVCYQCIVIVGIHILFFLLGGFHLLRKLPVALIGCIALVATSGWIFFLYLFGEGRQLDVEPSVALLHIVTMLLFALFLIAEGAAILTYAIQQKKIRNSEHEREW